MVGQSCAITNGNTSLTLCPHFISSAYGYIESQW